MALSVSWTDQDTSFLQQPLDVPIEQSKSDYQGLLEQIKELSNEDCLLELFDAARFDDIDVLRALLHSRCAIILNQQDTNGNTALHMAAGNGHLRIVKLLLSLGADVKVSNTFGNTPLHWAATNGHEHVVSYVLKVNENNVDVLQRNIFGRSILTEGFCSENPNVIQSLLEHESACEERLVETETAGGPNYVIHDLVLSVLQNDTKIPVRVRELAMATNNEDFILGQDNPEQDTTGLGLWAASIVCAQWMVSRREWFASLTERTILELGAGCGLPSLVVASMAPTCCTVVATDFNPKTVDNCDYNIQINDLNNNMTAQIINWNDSTTWPSDKVDALIGSDLIYQNDMVPLLVQTITVLLLPNGIFLYVAPTSGRKGHEEFLERMGKWFQCTVQPAPKEYASNPLTSQDDEDCFLHFNELSSSQFLLYEFQWKS